MLEEIGNANEGKIQKMEWYVVACKRDPACEWAP